MEGTIMFAHLKRCIYLLYLRIVRGENIRDYKIMKDLFSPLFRGREKYKEEINFLKKRNYITMFPYPFIDKYHSKDIEVFLDEKRQMYYVSHGGKRLYYPGEMTAESVKKTYCAVLLEQDRDSPHKYFSHGYEFEKDGVFIDVGCAEANMALEIVDRAKKVLLFEAEKKWEPALRATFEPYKDKVIIINKYAGDKEKLGQTTIDAELALLGNKLFDEGVTQAYIKIDVEGAELSVLEGAAKLMQTSRVMCACCTYHKQEDAEVFANYFRHLGYQFEFSKGYAIFKASQDLEYPYFRKCLLRAKNYDR